MSMLIKICGLRDAATVEAAVAAGANAVGFVFAESVRRVTPAEANVAARQVPESVLRVAVMRHPASDEWQAVLDEFVHDVLQTDAEDFAGLDVPDNVVRWPVVREGSAAVAAELPEVFVYEGADSGVGTKVDWSDAADVAARGRMILAGGLATDNVATAIRVVSPWGVDVSSAVESSPGHKDIEKISQFISAVRAAENDS